MKFLSDFKPGETYTSEGTLYIVGEPDLNDPYYIRVTSLATGRTTTMPGCCIREPIKAHVVVEANQT